MIDVSVAREIAASPESVVAVMFDPTSDPRWMKAVTRSEPLDGSFAIGSRVRRHARFLARDISWITVVTAYEPTRRLELRIDEGPFTGAVCYTITATTGSNVEIRNVGTPGKFAWMPTALVRHAMQRALAKDLHRLAATVETVRS